MLSILNTASYKLSFQQKIFVLALLAICSLLGNVLHLPLFFGVDFIFGSIAVMLTIAWFGLLPAAIVAAIGSLYTYQLWGHGYAIVIFTFEAIFVAYLYRRGWRNLVLADLVYWLTIGVGLVFLFYVGFIGMQWQSAALIALKQPFNGLFNALVAGLLLISISAIASGSRWFYQTSQQLSNLFFHAMLCIILLAGTIPLVYMGHYHRELRENTLFEQLHKHGLDIQALINEKTLDQIEKTNLPHLKTNNTGIAILSQDEKVITSKGIVWDNVEQKSPLRHVNQNLLHWAPTNIKNAMQQWRQGRYRVVIPTEIQEDSRVFIVIETPAQKLIETVQKESSQLFVLLATIFLVGLFLARTLSEWLTRSMNRLSLVASETMNGVVITDYKGNIEWVNEGFIRISGYQLHEFHGKKPGSLLQGKNSDKTIIQKMHQALQAEESFDVEIINYHKSGAPYWVRIQCNPLTNDQGKLQGFMAIETDISDLKQVEEMKSEFVSTVSHELRTPLTAISGTISLLHGGALGKFNDQTTLLLDTAHNNCKRLSLLIDDLLDMDKLISGKMYFDIQKHTLTDLLNQSIANNTAYAEQYQVNLQLTQADHVEIQVDQNRFQQIMSNLISNAVKYSNQGDHVEIFTSLSANKVRISVKDFGPGMPEEFQARIFQKFSQADSSTTRQKGGTGLGLVITKELTERMNGTISFHSIEGEGCCFYVEFPIN